jgi:hypothetical protein
MGSTLDEFRDRNSFKVSWFPPMGSPNHLEIFLNTGSFPIFLPTLQENFWSMIFFIHLHTGSSVYHLRFPPLFFTWWKFNELLMVTEYFYKSLRINITKIWGLLINLFLKGLKNLYDHPPLGTQRNEHVSSKGLTICQTRSVLGLALTRPRCDWVL